MKKLLKVLLILFAIECTLAVHEYGHLKAMQKHDVGVKEFSLGIGPKFYQKQTQQGFFFSIRAIPIAAYVMSTEEGQEKLEQSSLLAKLDIYSAGVRNNIIAGLIFVFLLQLIIVIKKRLPLEKFLLNILKTPIQLIILYFYAVIAILLTVLWPIRKKIRFSIPNKWGFEVIADSEWKRGIKFFIWINVLIGLLNIMPLIILDGGKIFLALVNMPNILLLLWTLLSFLILFSIFFFGKREDFKFVIRDTWEEMNKKLSSFTMTLFKRLNQDIEKYKETNIENLAPCKVLSRGFAEWLRFLDKEKISLQIQDSENKKSLYEKFSAALATFPALTDLTKEELDNLKEQGFKEFLNN